MKITKRDLSILFLPKEVIKEWENDYKIMQSNMIVGESPSFEILIQTMEEIMKILNND